MNEQHCFAGTSDERCRHQKYPEREGGRQLYIGCRQTIYTERKEADFIACQIWGKSAEVLGKSVHKGQRILLEGRLQIRQYTDKNGNKRTAAEVVTERFEFIERKEQTEPQGMENFGQQMPFDEEIPF